jgi:hypothetical protein
MQQAYVITEDIDVEILKKLLPAQLTRAVEFIPSSYSASSKSSTLLAVKRTPLALVVDAHTDDETAIYERQDTLQYLLRQAAVRVPFKVLLAIPSIETIFFQDRPLLEQLLNRHLTDTEWELAKYHPKKSLTYFLGENPLPGLLSKLTDQAIMVLQKHPLIMELVEFLSSVTQTPTEVKH